MALEKSWEAVRVPFTANGTLQGVIEVADTTGFFNKSLVLLTSSTQPNLSVEVKYVLSETELIVGPIGKGINAPPINVSAYLVSDNAIISAAFQPKPSGPTPDEIIKAVYQRDPTVAIRTFAVDYWGNGYTPSNPLPVAFTSEMPNVVMVASGDGSGNELKVNADGSINAVIAGGTGASEVNISVFNEITSVPSGVATLVASYTVPMAVTNSYLQRIEMSGENIAVFDIQINSVVSARKRTYWGDFNAVSVFISDEPTRGLSLNPEDVVQVWVIHMRPSAADFEARIQAVEVTE